MRIVYDHQIFSTQRYGGITRYFTQLATRLAKRGDCDVAIVALAHVNAYLADIPRGLVCGVRVPAVAHTGRARLRVNDAISRAYLRWAVPDVVHHTYYPTDHQLAPPHVATVLTVYDMIHERCATLFQDSVDMAARKARAVQRASHVICISEATRRDLLESIPVDPSRVSVVHLATDFHTSASQLSKYGGGEVSAPYLLFVGERRGYKNFSRLTQALRLLPQPLRALRLVLFGGGAIRPSEWGELSGAGLGEMAVTHLEGDDALLRSLYANAVALVYPSLYEGFGIPVLEAMACGCPVICGKTSSLPEVAGSAAEFCDPTEPASIAAAIAMVADSPGRAAELRDLGRARALLFSWERCAAETYAVYQSIL